VALEFVQEHPNDLIGAISFARSAIVLSPLTLDHEAVISSIKRLKIPQDLNQQGTVIGYAIFKTANLIAAMRQNLSEQYKLHDALLVLVTDGFQDPNPLDKGRRFRTMDVDEASDYAKEQGVRVFIVNVDPSINTEKFLPNKHQM